MSTRALRKLQREQELEKQLAAAQAAQQDDEDEQESEQEDDEVLAAQPRNAFDMLNEAADDEDPSDDQLSGHEEGLQSTQLDDIEPAETTVPKKKKKKAKQKKKKKLKQKVNNSVSEPESGDEIDRALRELAAKSTSNQDHAEEQASSWETQATKLLAIDHKNLNPTNEMRSLFGNIALENHDSTSSSRNQRRRDANLQGGVDLGTALTGRYSLASRGKELGALASRRNCLVQGKVEWPLAASGGLSMENTSSEGFEKQYKLIHNRQYQQVQQHFRAAVNSMQADQMIGVLMANPYHVATLLQVSEIAKHQGDHSVSGDLLERALFTIGRSVHSSFPSALREGIARLDFNEAANREFYLAIWRYIRNLEMRGTWRTCFEWAKLLLQFNTLSDPYGVTLMIDQLALRGRQHTQLLQLSSDDAYGVAWRHLPNIQISLALAYMRSKQPTDARRQLAIAMHNYPYILQALASALEISPMPKALWGKIPSTDAEKLYTELYVHRARDLWNTPETTTLISEVAETLEYYKDIIDSEPPASALEISLEEARHIMLLEVPQLIALLPRRFTTMPTSSSDVLPPPSSMSDFTSRAPAEGVSAGPNPLQAIFSAAGNAAGAPLQGANGVLQRILNWFHAPAGPTEANSNGNNESEGQAAFRAMREQLQAANGGEEVTDEMVEQVIRIQLGDRDQEHITAAGLGMAGAWDSEDEHDIGDNTPPEMPELEPIGDQGRPSSPPSNPHAATVEEEESDDDQARSLSHLSGRAILRHVDSDDEDTTQNTRTHPNTPHHTLFTPVSPRSTSTGATTSTEAATTSNPDPGNEILNSNDPQRIQRYLLTAGFASLQSNPANLPHYVERLKLLRKQQQDWIVNMIAQRGADGKDAAERVRRAL